VVIIGRAEDDEQKKKEGKIHQFYLFFETHISSNQEKLKLFCLYRRWARNSTGEKNQGKSSKEK
jgi:hypothetical protein